MAFAWLRCEQHPWLGVSVLVVGNSTPVCYLENGSAHVIDQGELKDAS